MLVEQRDEAPGTDSDDAPLMPPVASKDESDDAATPQGKLQTVAEKIQAGASADDAHVDILDLLQKIIQGVEETDSDTLGRLLGASSLDRLSEATSEQHENKLAGSADALQKLRPMSLESCDAQMPTRTRQRYETLKQAVVANKTVAGGTVGNMFRTALATDADLKNRCEGKGRRDMEVERIQWCVNEIAKMDSEFKVTRKHKSLSETMGKMRNLGQIIVDQGGLKDIAAVKGSLIVTAQCAAVPPPGLVAPLRPGGTFIGC